MLSVRSRVLVRYAWFAPHTEDFGWIGPTASLLLPGSDPPELSALGRIYGGFALPEAAAAANGTAALTADDLAALTSPLAPVQKAGSWLAACADCMVGESGMTAGMGAADGDGGRLAQHCRDCGLGSREGTGQGVLTAHVGTQA